MPRSGQVIDAPAVTGQARDQTQVMCLAREFRDRDRAGTLAGLFAATSRRAGCGGGVDPWRLLAQWDQFAG